MFSANSYQNRPQINLLAGAINLFLLILSVDGKYTIFTNFNTSYPKNLFISTGTLDRPSWSDPAVADPPTRLRICEEISRSGVLAAFGMNPVDMTQVYKELQQPKYSKIFRTIYGSKASQNQEAAPKYINRYRRLEMEIGQYASNTGAERWSARRDEYSFLCLLEIDDFGDSSFAESEEVDPYPSDEGDVDQANLDRVINSEADIKRANLDAAVNRQHSDSEEASSGSTYTVELVPFYVSKLYSADRGLHAYRFIFLEIRNSERRDTIVMLAAESAHAYDSPDFNVELHYIKLRKRHRPVRNCKQDPVCKFKSEDLHNERRFQLCATVLGSSYFADRVQYPSHISYSSTQNFWYTEQIFFRTSEGLEQGAGEFYKEFVVPCHADTASGDEKVFYISRAYNPYQVFVCTKDPVNDQLYLENLITNVSLVHERYNFGDVEI